MNNNIPRNADEDFGPSNPAEHWWNRQDHDEYGPIPRGLTRFVPAEPVTIDRDTARAALGLDPDGAVPPLEGTGPYRDRGGPLPSSADFEPARSNVRAYRRAWVKTGDGTFRPLGELPAVSIADVLEEAIQSVTIDVPQEPVDMRALARSIAESERAAAERVLSHASDDGGDPVLTYDALGGVRAHPEFSETFATRIPHRIVLRGVPFKRPTLRDPLYGVLFGLRWNVIAARDEDGRLEYRVRRGAHMMDVSRSLAAAVDYALEGAAEDAAFRDA